ncbi:TPR-like protein, partial [Nadsonia fulvescens var. elongata DSM 6958]
IEHLRCVIWHSLDNQLLKTAAFTTERLRALDPGNVTSIYLSALVFYKQRRFKAAVNLTNGISDLGCLHLYALSCLELKRWADGILALESSKVAWKSNLETSTSTDRRTVPDSSVCYTTLGKLYQCAGDYRKASESYAAALKVNPYIWEAFESLCDMGVNLDIDRIFHTDSLFWSVEVSELYLPTSAETMMPAAGMANLRPSSSPYFDSLGGHQNSPSISNRNIGGLDDHLTTPVDIGRFATPQNSNAGIEIGGYPPALNVKKTTGVSSRLNSSTSESNRSRPSTFRDEAKNFVRGLYSSLASGLLAFSRYECQKALHIFNNLSEFQRDTPWVLSKLGRIHFEVVSYAESRRYFERLRELDRTRIEDMEYYSTLLWHLHKDVDLSFLAHELIDIDRAAPQAWCAVGNSFSLQHDIELALKCFKRATQLDSSFAYAYTLQGHEFVSNDAFENAQDAFRLAIRANRRHYNAWYGLGMVYMKLGENESAGEHFEKAVAINPVNIILICCVGMIFEKMDKVDNALECYKRACELQPSSALSRYRKARLLMSLNLYNQALIEFEILKSLAPDEASVHYLMGQLYKHLNRRELAVKHFTIALNLDPKGSHLIKEALEALN